MGYADRITSSLDVEENTRKQANIIKIQSVKIKNLVQDLNLVSQLNYNVQPVKQTPVHLCKMIREIVVEYLNNNLNNKFDFELNLDCNTEQISIIGDERLLYRAIQNIISNSINHNENGCTISVSLAVNRNNLILVISDNGKGISEEKLQKIQSTPHYLQSTDERLDLRHGLGLLLVKEIISTVWLPKTVAELLVQYQKDQKELQEFLGDAYNNYNLVIALENGNPVESRIVRDRFQKLCEQNGYEQVVFHSLRHLSTGYKLKMTNGDVKSVQGDTGHAEAEMVTDVYSEIIDEDRRYNAQKMDEQFYSTLNHDSEMQPQNEEVQPENNGLSDSDMELLQLLKSLTPEMKAMLLKQSASK